MGDGGKPQDVGSGGAGGGSIGQTAPFAVQTITDPQQMAQASAMTPGENPPGAMAYQYPGADAAKAFAQPNAAGTLFTMFGTPLNQQQYNPGDEWQYLSQPQSWGALIDQLVASGYLSRTAAIQSGGSWNATVADAMKRAQADANHYQAHVGDYMNWIASGGPGGPGITSTAVQDALAAKTKAKSDPLLHGALAKMKATPEVAQGIYDAMLNLTGNYASAGDTKNFITWYQNQELQARQDYLNRGGMNSGTYYAPPSISTAAEQYVLQHNAAQVQGFATASRMIEFYKLMGVNI